MSLILRKMEKNVSHVRNDMEAGISSIAYYIYIKYECVYCI